MLGLFLYRFARYFLLAGATLVVVPSCAVVYSFRQGEANKVYVG